MDEERCLPIEQNPHDWWGFRGNGECIVVFRLVKFISAVEIAYKEVDIKIMLLLHYFSMVYEVGCYFLKAVVETN
jgi:hypothetical protein